MRAALLAAVVMIALVGCGDEETAANQSSYARAVAALKNGTTPQRVAAAARLGELGDARAVRPLTAALGDPSAAVRKAAIGALQTLPGERASLRIAAQLKSDDDSLRVAAAEALEKLATPQTIPALTGALADERMIVRSSAAKALATLGEPAVAPTVRVLREGPPEARVAAAKALGRLGGGASTDALAEALEAESPELRLTAAAALAGLGDGRAVPALLDLLENPLSQEQLERYRQRMERTPTGPQRAVLIDRLMRRRNGGLPIVVRYGHQAKKRKKLLDAEAEHIRTLTGAPLSEAARKELACVLAARVGWDEWDAMPQSRRETMIRREAAQLRSLVAQDRGSWGGSLVEQYFLERHRAQWWASLSQEQKAEEIRKAAAKPVRRELESRRRQVRGQVARSLARVGTPDAVETLLGILQGRDRDRRELLRREVRMAGNSAARALAEYAALGDRSEKNRIEALKLLRTIHGASAPQALADLLDADSAEVRKLAGLAIAEDSTTDALPWVLTLLNADSRQVRREAVRRLGQARYGAAVAGLSDALSDGDPTVRFLAADALGAIGDPNAVGALAKVAREARDEPTPAKATLAAVRALGEIGESDALELVLDYTEHRSGDMRSIALSALGGFDDPRALRAALSALGRDDAADRKAAVWALKGIGPPAVGPLIEMLLSPDESLHTPAGQALFAIGPPAVDPLMDRMTTGPDTLKLVAIRVVGERRPKGALKPLVALLGDGNADIRASAVWALGRLRNRKAVPALKRALKDEDPRVVKAARVALWKLK